MENKPPILDFDSEIRPLLPLHARELARIRHRAIREMPEAFGTPPEIELARGTWYYRRKLIRLASHQNEMLLGLWQDAALVGMGGLGRRLRDFDEFALVYSMYVVPEARGRGLASALLEFCTQHAKTLWNVSVCRLTVETNNTRALGLYQRAGFRVVDQEENAFKLKGNWHDVYHLEKRLEASPAPK